MTPHGPAPDALPRAVDRYHLIRPIGRGGSGIVCEAQDTSLGCRVALKLIPRDQAHSAGWSGCSREEARLAGRVRHPHVVSLLHAGTYAGGEYLVMELVEGRSVQTVLAGGPLPWREATAILVAACAGVAAVHAVGILHRDIKPANLLRRGDGTVKLTDFGLGFRLRRTGPHSTSNGPAGTPSFMSPEQCRDEACDERADIYSLGATYFALLTGRAPYADVSPFQVLFAQCSAPVPDPRCGHRRVPTACARIVARAMAKTRADRYDSALEMRGALMALFQGEVRDCGPSDLGPAKRP